MKLTRIDERIKACEDVKAEYRGEIPSGFECRLCLMIKYERDECLWTVFEKKDCLFHLEENYKNRITRLNRWIRKLKKMKEGK